MDNLRSLFIALNDEVISVRELAISTIGRLSIRNPAYVMPLMRKTVIQILTELEFSNEIKVNIGVLFWVLHFFVDSRRKHKVDYSFD